MGAVRYGDLREGDLLVDAGGPYALCLEARRFDRKDSWGKLQEMVHVRFLWFEAPDLVAWDINGDLECSETWRVDR